MKSPQQQDQTPPDNQKSDDQQCNHNDWEILSSSPSEYEPSMESGAKQCRECGLLAFYSREKS